jgi:hypothetical protein
LQAKNERFGVYFSNNRRNSANDFSTFYIRMMKLDLNKPLDVERFRLRGKMLIEKKAKIDLTEHKNKRSVKQNSLYWMWLTCIQDETGNDKNDLHKYFAEKFLGIEEVEIFGVKQLRIKSTPDNDTKEFTDYLEKIRLFVAEEQSIYLPSPQMQGYEDFIFTYN